MDFKDNPKQASFRKNCREWLEKNAKLKIGVEKNEFANIDFLQAAKDWQKKKLIFNSELNSNSSFKLQL